MNNINIILKNWNNLKLLQSNIQDKKENILSCIGVINKGINIEHISLKQKRIAFSLRKDMIRFNKEKKLLLKEVVKSLNNSYPSLINICIMNNISSKELKPLKECFKYFNYGKKS